MVYVGIEAAVDHFLIDVKWPKSCLIQRYCHGTFPLVGLDLLHLV